MFDIGLEGNAVHRAVEDHGCGHAIYSERPGEGCRLPVPVWHRGTATFSPEGTSSQPGHLGRGTGLVDEDQAPWVEVRLVYEPSPAPGCDVGPILLGCVRCFYGMARPTPLKR